MDGETNTDARLIALRTLASRRAAVCGLAGAGALAALGACGTKEAPNTDPSAEESAGADESESTDQQSESASEEPEALAATSDVPVGGGVVVEDFVIVQPEEGDFAAFNAHCPHEGTVVQAPDDQGTIVCPNHFSEFTIEGELQKGPADAGLGVVEIEVADDKIYLA
ncbi:QcrA and Rieske domain-containing protein [Salininema proteolyticum]|uniref:Ubiquinol-cytochrome c reductase iron-sulfur subunit n=1 Tax=Salininema proteolyticum TaxID=1607685 RepID=A0ABV8TXV7_9ACTN